MAHETILVTGGSSGIGRAIVETLVEEGRHVAFTYRHGERAARAIESAHPQRAVAFALDLRDAAAPAALVERIEAERGPVVGLVNNAAVRKEAILALIADDELTEVIETNLLGAMRCCRAVMRGMISRRGGAIVNVSSLSALHGVRGQSAYAASKAGLLGMTRSLAREVGKKGVRVNAIAPGFVATQMTAELPAEVVRSLRANECLAAGVDARGVADTVAFLLSERSAAITGQCIAVDAGASA